MIHRSSGLLNRRKKLASAPGRIQQVFWSLLKNAAKCTPKNGTITISTRTIGDDFEIEISDTGIGLGAEAGLKIFEVFE